MIRVLILVFAVTGLSACKTTEPTYYYGGFQKVIYGFFKGDELSLTQQIDAMENIISSSMNVGRPVAPGVHAHLGMLYFESGNQEMGLFHFNKEKEMYPESTHFIDFLINSNAGGNV